MDWQDEIKAHFPDWGTAAARLRWPAIRTDLSIGQTVSGRVIARAPFGIWLNIGIDIPALLLVTEMQRAKLDRITFEDYPVVGSQVEGQICALSDVGEVIVTQQRPEEDPWRDPSEFAVGKEFACRVVRVMNYGYLMETRPGVWALLPPERTDRRLEVGDEIRARVECVEPVKRTVEVSLVGVEDVPFNRDWQRRNAVLKPFLRTDGPFADFDESAAIFWFHGVPVDVLGQLLQERYMDPNERRNDSPSSSEFFALMRKHPEVLAHGHATSIVREDYRVSIEGISHPGPLSEALLRDAKQLCGSADQFRVDEHGLYVWFD